jgi:hypothetical protein
MEGELKRWENIFWKINYFILYYDILTYCDKKGGKKLGSIHLKVSEIIFVPDDPLRIIINTGISDIILRAKDT